MGEMKGKASLEFEHPPVIVSAASVVGKKEGEGPLPEPVFPCQPAARIQNDLDDAAEDAHYYRDDNQVQHVPKKKLDDILI